MKKRVSCVWMFLALSVSARAEDPAEIVETSGVRGGLVVVIGVDDGDTLGAYRANDSYLVHGLDTNPAKVAAVREQLIEKGLYGKVSVDVFDGKTLPYIDRLVNLVVSGAGCPVSGEEVERVLAPRGVALIEGKRSVQPVPSDIDDWGHFLYDSAAKNSSRDRVAYFPEHLQWEAGPLHDRHHDTVQGIETIVSCKGRLFYIVDDAPPSVSEALPERWRLVARDAFSGVLLWKRDMGEFGWKAWAEKALIGRFNNPKDMQRRVVAVGDRVYATLAYNSPVSEIDAVTGKVLKTYKGTEATSEILHVDGKLILGIRQGGAGVMAVRADDGNILWQYDADDGASSLSRQNLFLCAGGGGVYFFAGDGITGIDAGSGKRLWHNSLQAAAAKGKGKLSVGRYAYPSLLYHDGAVVVLKSTGEITAFSARAGDRLWQSKQGSLTYGTRGALFVAQDLIWSYGADLRSAPELVGLDPKTGEVVRTIDCAGVKNAVVGHMRCYPAKATEKTFWTTIGGKPQQVVHLDTGENCSMAWLRAGCRIGIVPANGLLYMTPHPCGCHAEIMLNGLLAMGPARTDGVMAASPSERLVKGPAYKQVSSPTSRPRDLASDCWPMHRCSGSRLASTKTTVSATLREAWKADLGGMLTQPVVADGKVFVASTGNCTMHALKADTGDKLWSFTAGGRIDSSPTYHDGAVLFGSADGWVYCLTAVDGTLVWKFRAAPVDRRMVSFGRIESLWPVHGSVLMRNGEAIVAAGRTSWLDGGIHLYALDPVTGRVLATGNDNVMGTKLPTNPSPGMLSDLLVTHGEHIYMRTSQIQRTPSGFHVVRDTTAQKGGPGTPVTSMDYRDVLMASDGMLEPTWNHREGFLLNGVRGQAMACDGDNIYHVQIFASWGHSAPFEPGQGNVSLTARSVAGNDKKWSTPMPIRVTSLVAAGDLLFAAGPADTVDAKDLWGGYEGRKGAKLVVCSKADGKTQVTLDLPSVPAYDAMSAAHGSLYVAFADGSVRRFAGK